MIGGFLHRSQIDKLGLTDQAGADLYAAAVALQLDTLAFAYKTKRADQSWATLEFFLESAIQGLRDGEQRNGCPITKDWGPMTEAVVAALVEIKNLPKESQNERFSIMAAKIAKIDSSANLTLITQLLQDASVKYFFYAMNMF